MTVALGLRLSNDSGIILADSLVRYGRMQETGLGEKLYVDDRRRGLPPIIAGGEGTGEIILRTYTVYAESDAAGPDAFVDAMLQAKWDVIDVYLRSSFNVTYDEYVRGSSLNGTPLNDHVTGEINKVIDSQGGEVHDILDNSFIILDTNGMILSKASMLGVGRLPSVIPYAAVGSGEDAANATLSRFYGSFPREMRARIPLGSGVRAAITALNEASDNHEGVGGVASIVLVHDGAFYRPDERQSHLASQIVSASSHGLVPDGFVERGLESLVVERDVFDAVDEEFKNAATDPRALELMLRGFIV